MTIKASGKKTRPTGSGTVKDVRESKKSDTLTYKPEAIESRTHHPSPITYNNIFGLINRMIL